MLKAIQAWRERRWLKRLGPVEPGHLTTSVRFQQRSHQADAMPGLILLKRPEFHAVAWIQAGRAMPQVKGELPGGEK